jgi:prevent-host-death family protein
MPHMVATISCSELRNHTTKVLRRVQAGEELEVLYRSIPMARLCPISKGRWMPGEELLARLQEIGPDTTGQMAELRETFTETTDDLKWFKDKDR